MLDLIFSFCSAENAIQSTREHGMEMLSKLNVYMMTSSPIRK